jgi:hypothetical protein
MFDQQVYAIHKRIEEEKEAEEKSNPKQLSLF